MTKSSELIDNINKYIIENSSLPDYSEIDTITRCINFDFLDPSIDENEIWNSIISLCNTLITKKIPIFTNYKFHRLFSFISLYNYHNSSINTVFMQIINNELYNVAQYINDISNIINDNYDKYSIIIPDYVETYLINMFPNTLKRISWEEITNNYVIMAYEDIYKSSVEIFNILTELHTLSSTLYHIFQQDIFRQVSVDIINVILYDKVPIISI